MHLDQVYYYRQYQNDIPILKEEEAHSDPRIKRIQSIVLAILPLLGFISILRIPLSTGLSCMRSFRHMQTLIEAIEKGNYGEVGISSVRLVLSLSALILLVSVLAQLHLNPIVTPLLSGADDLIGSIIEIIHSLKKNDGKGALQALFALFSTLLYLNAIYSGRLDLLALFMLLQILSNLYKSAEFFRKGQWIEGVCYLITALLTVHQVIPILQAIYQKGNSNQRTLSSTAKASLHPDWPKKEIVEVREIGRNMYYVGDEYSSNHGEWQVVIDYEITDSAHNTSRFRIQDSANFDRPYPESPPALQDLYDHFHLSVGDTIQYEPPIGSFPFPQEFELFRGGEYVNTYRGYFYS